MCGARFPVLLELADLCFKCQGCFTLPCRLQLPLTFPCLKQHLSGGALVPPELSCAPLQPVFVPAV